ncbi:hypothetical protein N7481_011605 [Penicillium waksmanii]|uniref:uncharacterized protein n=1 Tax=Penicillium waksmanii TaxID=69791 RepID=UPI00254799D6|nr:uncharacterized protein N7481_011605 [Penicillium waksmanii]KAJ5974395.1 hypothetical protein N7481_011605 [Penicillium waksmanii]
MDCQGDKSSRGLLTRDAQDPPGSVSLLTKSRDWFAVDVCDAQFDPLTPEEMVCARPPLHP